MLAHPTIAASMPFILRSHDGNVDAGDGWTIIAAGIVHPSAFKTKGSLRAWQRGLKALAHIGTDSN
jgi:hypothetical protein